MKIVTRTLQLRELRWQNAGCHSASHVAYYSMTRRPLCQRWGMLPFSQTTVLGSAGALRMVEADCLTFTRKSMIKTEIKVVLSE